MAEDKETQKKYRPNVAAVVLDEKDRILACRRADRHHAWQIPQGGVHKNEALDKAVLRELEEEVGIKKAAILGMLPEPIRYDWPEDVRRGGFEGQEQRYFLLRIDKSQSINLNLSDPPEFDNFEWLEVDEFFSRIHGFKAHAYRSGISQLLEMFADGVARENNQ